MKPRVQAPLNIFLLGDPAAGKATQAAFLMKKFPLYDLDMGKEIRMLQRKDPKVRMMLKQTYDKGKVTQTNLARDIFEKRIFSCPKSKGILFDGNPKMIGEAKLVYKWLKLEGRERSVIIYLSVPMDETVKRMANRMEYFRGKFSKRTDDNDAALKNRVKYYRTQISQVLEFYKSRYPYKKISGIGTPEQVSERILKFLSKHV